MGFDIAFGIERMSVRHQHIIKVLVRQHDVGIQRQTTDLAKQHLRQGKAVLCLQQRRFRFVQLYFHRKLVGSGRHAFGHQLIHIVGQRAERLGIVLGQFQLVGDGNDLPIGLVRRDHRFLLLHLQLRLGQFLQILGNLVVSIYLAASENRLLNGNYACINVFGVDFERIAHLLADLVQGILNIEAHQVGDKFVDGWVVLQQSPSDDRCRVALVDLQQFLAVGIDLGLRHRADAAERRQILIAQELEALVVVHVSSRCLHFGKVVGIRGIHLVPCLVDFRFGHFQFLVVLQREAVTFVQSQHPLCIRCDSH